MKSTTGVERVIDSHLESPECTVFEASHKYRVRRRVPWSPENYSRLNNLISFRMVIPREDALYVDCAKTKENGIDNILLLLVSKFYSLSPLDVARKMDTIRHQLAHSVVFPQEPRELSTIDSVEQLIATYQEKFGKLTAQYSDNQYLTHLDNSVFHRIISDLSHNTRAIYIDNVAQLSLTEQQRITDILSTRGHIGDTRFALKINNGNNAWKVWKTRSGEWVERTHDYTSYSLKQDDLPK